MTDAAVLALLLLVALAVGVGVIHSKHESRRLNVELQELQVEAERMETQWQLLQLEKSTLTADAEVVRAARKQLNMVVPDPGEVKYIIR